MSIVDRYIAGEHLRQIAEAEGLSHETVRQRLLRAGVTLRRRSSGSDRKLKREALSGEVLEDLSRWPEGATVADLMEWYGKGRAEVITALAALLADGTIKILSAGTAR